MTTPVRHWWTACCGDNEVVTIEPIPFPSRRARMMLKPPHAQSIGTENQLAAANASATFAALDQTCRRMDVLARELDCLWFYEDESEGSETDPPSAA